MTAVEVADLTADAARLLTDEIRHRLDDLLPLIKQAYEGRADRALGYESWQDYCAAELAGVRIPLADRPAAVAELRAAGMSQRAIGSALGVSQSTVRDDLAELSTSTQSPERITSLDGRERPASRATVDHPSATGEADARLDAAVAPAASEVPTGVAAPVGAGDSTPPHPAPAPVAELPHSTPEGAGPQPAADPLDDPAQIEAEHRKRSSQDVATGLISLYLRLDPDPIRWLTRTWQPDAYRNRDLPRVRDVFTASGLRAVAKHLDTIADHLDRTGGSL